METEKEFQEKINRLETQLKIAEKALNDIKDWNDDLEYLWEDQGYRADCALLKITELSN